MTNAELYLTQLRQEQDPPTQTGLLYQRVVTALEDELNGFANIRSQEWIEENCGSDWAALFVFRNGFAKTMNDAHFVVQEIGWW